MNDIPLWKTTLVVKQTLAFKTKHSFNGVIFPEVPDDRL
jgi:hypothetical protein